MVMSDDNLELTESEIAAQDYGDCTLFYLACICHWYNTNSLRLLLARVCLDGDYNDAMDGDASGVGSWIEDTKFAGKKCDAPSARVFDLRNADATVDKCSTACGLLATCKFFSIVKNSWCIGCSVEPTATHNMAATYRFILTGDCTLFFYRA